MSKILLVRHGQASFGAADYDNLSPTGHEQSRVLGAALAIHTVEARHASWIRHLNGASPAPVAFDKSKSMQQVLAAVTATGFITKAPATTSSGGSPSFTG